jgi:hypothetical protein
MIEKLAVLAILLVPLACAEPPEITETYGEPITLQEQTRISKIMAEPQSFVGKRVLVKGEVLDVCPSKGCWIELDSNAPDEEIQVKVDDDVIVFPQSLKGKTVLVEGTVEELHLTKEQVLAKMEHEAEEYGKEFDPTREVTEETIYRIRGIGAGVLN